MAQGKVLGPGRTNGLLMKPAICKTIYTTDDGSKGVKGNVLEELG